MKIVKGLHLLTTKEMLYVANVSEDDIIDPSENKYVQMVKRICSKWKFSSNRCMCKNWIRNRWIRRRREKVFLEELGIEESGLDQLIRAAYDLLGLATYFTAGVQEVRAWTFKQGMKAPQCAGVIHTDFERGFIRAETVSYDDLMTNGSMTAAKEAGKVRLEGKEYIVKDGDVMHFRFNV